MTDSTAKLEKLIEMLREGFLTREEFDAQKAKVLASDTVFGHPSPPVDLLAGATRIATPEKIGSYRILSPIGRGGMGSVYRAKHQLDPMSRKQGGDVALKLMHAHLAENEGFRARFIDEAKHGMDLDHPGIVKVHDVLIDDGDQLGLVMGLCEGETLEKRSAGQSMALSGVVNILRPIAEALDYVHARNIVHRDLKPENIKFDAQNRPMILDFGIAKDTDGEGKTKTGTGMGTVAYMAPEQYTDAKRVGPGSDQYALGIIAYELLTGGLPWPSGESEFQIMTTKAQGSLPTLDSAVAPAHVSEAITRATALDPSHRFESCSAFVDALDQPEGQVHPTEPPAKPLDTKLQKNIPGPGELLASFAEEERERRAEDAAWQAGPGSALEYYAEKANERQAESERTINISDLMAEAARREAELVAEGERLKQQMNHLRPSEPARGPGELLGSFAEIERGQQSEDAGHALGPGALLSHYAEQEQSTEQSFTVRHSVEIDNGIFVDRFTGRFGLQKKKVWESRIETKVVDESFSMVNLIPGSFRMGLPNDHPDTYAGDDVQPQHTVHLNHAFQLGKVPVTQALWQAVMGRNPSYFKGNNQRPVDSVTWFDCIRFCNLVSEKCGLKPAYTIGAGDTPEVHWNSSSNGFRLPTEAEWEYAARAGQGLRYTYSGGDDIPVVGWSGWQDYDYGGTTHPVGEKSPNNWGLYDMSGNVWEWCWDWYGEDYYKVSPDVDPMGPSMGDSRILRGGAATSSSPIHIAFRSGCEPGDLEDTPEGVGLRIARTIR